MNLRKEYLKLRLIINHHQTFGGVNAQYVSDNIYTTAIKTYQVKPFENGYEQAELYDIVVKIL